MENKLYLIGVKCNLRDLAKQVGLVDTLSGRQDLAYFSFWKNVCIMEYDTNTKQWTIKFLNAEKPQDSFISFNEEKTLFNYMDENNWNFIYDDNNPLGDIFKSYSMAYLELVRWAADITYTREIWNNLLGE